MPSALARRSTVRDADHDRVEAPGPLLLAVFFLVPAAHPLLLPAVGVPSCLLWWAHVLPVAFITYQWGEKGAPPVISLSAVFLVAGERLFGMGYGHPAAWETVGSLAAALTFTNSLVAGFALCARRVEQALQHRATHDSLTVLPNRAGFRVLLDRVVARGRHNPDQRFAVLFLDIDQFKCVNDSLGHGRGDELLADVADRLRTAVRAADTVARVGGDELGILLLDPSHHHVSLRAADRIQDILKRSFHVHDFEIFITTSDVAYDSAEDMLRDADTAMYRAKEGGRRRAEVFNTAMHREAVALLELEADLRRAIDSNVLTAAWQPLVRLSDSGIVGFEALLRWNHPDPGPVPPGRFVGIAEETGLIGRLGDWMPEEVCCTVSAWRKRGMFPDGVRVHVNMSPHELQQPDFVDTVAGMLARHDLPGSVLGLEITETAVMADPVNSVGRLQALKKLGVHLSVDDFGTGYSSLSYFQRFPLDALKIDRSFVSAMDGGGPNSNIVRAGAALGRELDLCVVAEGVEKPEQAQALPQRGCELAQGWFFGRPMTTRKVSFHLARLMRRRGDGHPSASAPAPGNNV